MKRRHFLRLAELAGISAATLRAIEIMVDPNEASAKPLDLRA
jgi:hypothetical protein